MAVKTAGNTALPAIVKSPAFAWVRNMSRNDDVINPEPMYTHRYHKLRPVQNHAVRQIEADKH